MRIAGLDAAMRRSGAAVFDGSTFLFAEAFVSRGDAHGEIFDNFRTWWRSFLCANRIEKVAIEAPLRSDLTRTNYAVADAGAFGRSLKKTKSPMVSMAALLGLYGTRAHAVQICHALNIPYVEVNNQEWRSVIHGRRSAPRGTKDSSGWWKEQALTRCRQLGWNVPSKDAAEAALIAEWLRIELVQQGSPLSSGGLFHREAAQ